jgi:negative regulator of sigma E activity
MTMKHENDRASQQDRELSRRFTQMRQADAEQVPDFPSEEELAQRSPIPAVNPLYSRVRKVAVAAAVVVAVSILMTRPVPQDPGALYADIMSANAMATDQLMLVSQGASPEMSSMPGIFEIDLPEYTN